MADKTKMGKRKQPTTMKIRRAIEAKLKEMRAKTDGLMKLKPTRIERLNYCEGAGFCSALDWVLGNLELEEK